MSGFYCEKKDFILNTYCDFDKKIPEICQFFFIYFCSLLKICNIIQTTMKILNAFCRSSAYLMAKK